MLCTWACAGAGDIARSTDDPCVSQMRWFRHHRLSSVLYQVLMIAKDREKGPRIPSKKSAARDRIVGLRSDLPA